MRDAKLPEVYQSLVNHVKRCEELLEINYFSDAAAALAAYAIIHRDNKLQQQAKRLKIWAAWSAGRAAERLRPTVIGRAAGHSGQAPGARSLLREQGLNDQAASRALRLSRLTEKEIEGELEACDAPSMNRMARGGIGRGHSCGKLPFSDGAARLIGYGSTGGTSGNIAAHVSFCRANDARLANAFTLEEATRARALLLEIREWHDVFEQMLPIEERKE